MLTHTRSETGRFVLAQRGHWKLSWNQGRIPSRSPFQGQTDAEIAAHLIGKFAEEDGLSTLEAIKKKPSTSSVGPMLCFDGCGRSKHDLCGKKKSPLLIGLGDGYNMVCSDAMAMIRETNQYMEIHDQELVIVKADSVEVQDYDGNVKERASYTAELDLSDIGKGTYPILHAQGNRWATNLSCVSWSKPIQMNLVK